ncbi:MAG: hypothetical protein ACPIA2_17440 [Mariniblastus sp.]
MGFSVAEIQATPRLKLVSCFKDGAIERLIEAGSNQKTYLYIDHSMEGTDES